MSCEICGKHSCVKYFHSIEEQEAFDNLADKVKEKMKTVLMFKIRNTLDTFYNDEEMECILIDKVIDLIDSY